MNKIKRKLILKKETHHLGKIIETDNKIICYVNKDKIDFKKSSIDLILSNNIDKPIEYIFENINFKGSLFLLCNNKNVTIKLNNCNFNIATYIKTKGPVEINNCHFAFFEYLTIIANIISIKNMKENSLENLSKEVKATFYGDDLLNIDNSNITIPDNFSHISLYSDNSISLKNTNINSDSITISSPNIYGSVNNKIIADTTTIKTNNYNGNIKIDTNILTINDNSIITQSVINLRKSQNSKDEERQKLISLLKNIKNQVQQGIESKIKKLENTQIKKLLRR